MIYWIKGLFREGNREILSLKLVCRTDVMPLSPVFQREGQSFHFNSLCLCLWYKFNFL